MTADIFKARNPLPYKIKGVFGKYLVREVLISDERGVIIMRKVKYNPIIENGEIVYIADKRTARGVSFA